MVARWRGSMSAGQLRLRGGAGSGWRALPRQCGAGARGKRERGEAERRGPGSAAFRRGGAHSDERLARKGSSPRLTEASTGCARWRRNTGRDGVVDDELERLERPTPVRRWSGRCWRRARALLLLLSEREAKEMEEREADTARRV